MTESVQGTERPRYDPAQPARTGPNLVNWDLDDLRIGQNFLVGTHPDGYEVINSNIAPGDGWCRAVYAPECAWPSGADLCVVVEWIPDPDKGSDWDQRLATVTAALRSKGYLVEAAGRHPDPATARRACLLVYRMKPGRPRPERPDDAWAYIPPPRVYRYPHTSPRQMLQTAMGLRWGYQQSADGSHLSVWDIETALWPPTANFCARVRWSPLPGVSCDQAHDTLRQLAQQARSSGYRTRLAERKVWGPIESLDFLAYRVGPMAP